MRRIKKTHLLPKSRADEAFHLEIIGVFLVKFPLLYGLWYLATGRLWRRPHKEAGLEVEQHLFAPLQD